MLNFITTFITAMIVICAGLLLIAYLTGFHAYNVQSDSMSPIYPKGTLVIVKETKAKTIVVGDVITYVFNSEGTLVTHRVIGIDTDRHTFTTQGDANNVADPTPILWDNVIGKVIFSVPMAGDFYQVMTAKGNKNIMIAVIVGLGIVSIGWDIWDMKKKKEGLNEK